MNMLSHVSPSPPSVRARLERGAVVSLGAAGLDGCLPWGGLPRVGVHEVLGEAAFAWALALGARVLQGGGARQAREMLILAPPGQLCVYPPGLARFGIRPDQVLMAEAGSETSRRWAVEEALRSGSCAVVLALLDECDLTASRRLQLAAEAGDSMAVLLRRRPSPSATLTRWQADPAPSLPADAPEQDAPEPSGALGQIGPSPRWRVALQRCRGGRPTEFLAGWEHDALCLYPSAVLAD